jgi:hypothetical protein
VNLHHSLTCVKVVLHFAIDNFSTHVAINVASCLRIVKRNSPRNTQSSQNFSPRSVVRMPREPAHARSTAARIANTARAVKRFLGSAVRELFNCLRRSARVKNSKRMTQQKTLFSS